MSMISFRLGLSAGHMTPDLSLTFGAGFVPHAAK